MANSTIQASGGDYATIELWEADTDNDLVTAMEGEVGRMADELLFNGTGAVVVMSGATTSALYFRRLEPQGANYSPFTDTGRHSLAR